jgi:hypothetical protein
MYFLSLFRGSMILGQLYILGVCAINRKLPRSSVVLIFETRIHLVISQELSHEGVAVVVYCQVQCGVEL